MVRCIAIVIAWLGCGLAAAAAEPPAAQDVEPPRVDVVFCIDCSGSMGGVIETAKQKVWGIVNQVAKAEPAPVLRIGLMGYGDADRQFRSYDLSSDLDAVFQNLMTFKDEGWGDEYVGQIIHKATEEMDWTPGDQALRIIYVVGNETARQGPEEMDYARTAPAAKEKGILVNAIYCGDTDYANATPTWRQIAKLAGGQYLQIAGTGGMIAIATPFDEELVELSGRLNSTYLAFGRSGLARAAAQQVQDQNALSLSPTNAAERAVSKSSKLYSNTAWDLVDASREPEFDLSKIEKDQLPEPMRDMTLKQQQEYIETKAQERAQIQKQIAELSAKRDAFVKEQIEEQGLDASEAFDEAVKKSLVEQAKQKGFVFEE